MASARKEVKILIIRIILVPVLNIISYNLLIISSYTFFMFCELRLNQQTVKVASEVSYVYGAQQHLERLTWQLHTGGNLGSHLFTLSVCDDAHMYWSKTLQGEFILVTDRQSDASFLIHHFLCFYLRGELLSYGRCWRSDLSETARLSAAARCKVLFLGLVQSLNHYSSVSQRLVSIRLPHLSSVVV